MKVTAIIVTYNRPALLLCLLQAMEAQSRRPDRLLVVDNASGTETVDLIEQFRNGTPIPTDVVRSESNLGGAGGFSLGMKSINPEQGHWLWIMDDDAEPTPDCLMRLLELADSNENTFIGPAAVGHPPDEATLCWPTKSPDGKSTRNIKSLDTTEQAHSLPFLGLLFPSTCIPRIGLPEASLFISGDDVDYTMRARKGGYSLILNSLAILHHPLPEIRMSRIFGHDIWIQGIVPWKRYFEVRNRIWVSRQHFGLMSLAGVLLVTAFRWMSTMVQMPDRKNQSRAYLIGTIDGLLSRLDRRPLGP